MLGGYMGKILLVDLSGGKLRNEELDEKLCRQFVGGYGLGARIIYSRQKGGVDPLGPGNTLGFVTGPLTGTPALTGARYTVVGKSPLTGTWGDANSGGDFGPYLKFAGYDAVFFEGISEKPVYLLIRNGNAELRDGAILWGKDTYETEDMLKAELGEDARVACIGPAGENLSRISSVMNNKGRAAARSGLGAVMGSKKLKAIAVIGNMPVPLASKDKVEELRQKYMGEMAPMFVDMFRNFGTSGLVAPNVGSGDAPVKNWGGVGVRDFPNFGAISDANVIGLQEKNYACYRCPVACGGRMKAGTKYNYMAGAHKPEYETLAAFGTMCLNDNLESIVMANDICNRYGLDTISAGTTIAFAIECYENGIITKEDTEGIELTWGNSSAIVSMTEKLAKREGFGAVLADGVKMAADKIGKGADQYAMHVHGQELPMHDPKLGPGLGVGYRIDATPARHLQAVVGLAEGPGMMPYDKYSYNQPGRAEIYRMVINLHHVLQASGACHFGLFLFMPPFSTPVQDFLNAVTGWELSADEVSTIGERIATLRHAFNLREGLNSLQFKVPDRALGVPPPDEGPLKGVKIGEDGLNTMVTEYLKLMDWDMSTAKPSKKRLEELELEDVARELMSH